jgi:hypothetical protein
LRFIRGRSKVSTLRGIALETLQNTVIPSISLVMITTDDITGINYAKKYQL